MFRNCISISDLGVTNLITWMTIPPPGGNTPRWEKKSTLHCYFIDLSAAVEFLHIFILAERPIEILATCENNLTPRSHAFSPATLTFRTVQSNNRYVNCYSVLSEKTCVRMFTLEVPRAHARAILYQRCIFSRSQQLIAAFILSQIFV